MTAMIINNIIIVALMLFYMLGSLLVISSNNLIVCLFCLVFSFVAGILLFPFLHAEYLMVIFLIIYLGAIVVFFLFGVMLMHMSSMERSFPDKWEILFVSSILLAFFLCFCYCFSFIFPTQSVSVLFELPDIQLYYLSLTNVEKLGLCLFYQFGFTLVISGFLMYVAILGCIMILSKKTKKDVRYL